MARTKLEITLPKPPALNHLYGNRRGGGRYLKPAGVAWREECVLMVRCMGVPQMVGPLSLLVHLYTSKHQDNDSILKILMDSLEASEIIVNDYWIFDLRVIKHKCKKDDQRVVITLEEKC